MPYEQFNRLVQLLLYAAALLTIALLIIAARPVHRYRGSFPLNPGERTPILDDWENPAAFVRVTHLAAIEFPAEWNAPEYVCMTVRYERGTAPTALRFDDQLPQALWDQRGTDDLIVLPRDVAAFIFNGSQMTFIQDTLIARIEAEYKIQARWFGTASLILGKDQAAETLLCYTFIGSGTPAIPRVHLLRFAVENVAVARAPAFYVSYDSTDPQAENSVLKKVGIADYLASLLADSSAAVQHAP